MSDPYKVLNVSQSASDEDIKKAYRDLARKYHPDNYVDNPLSDLAQEKMKEINEAYDTITKSRQNGGSASSSSYGGGNGGYGAGGNYGWGGAGAGRSSNPTFQKIRELIMQGNVPLAENMLEQVAPSSRDAEWNFLKGSALYKKGWVNDARTYFESACRADPSNGEYRSALNRMNGQGQSYNPYQGQTQMGGCTACDCCTGMMCADMCCNCC